MTSASTVLVKWVSPQAVGGGQTRVECRRGVTVAHWRVGDTVARRQHPMGPSLLGMGFPLSEARGSTPNRCVRIGPLCVSSAHSRGHPLSSGSRDPLVPGPEVT